MHDKNILTAGKPIGSGKKALVMLHGRGASADDILSLAPSLNVGDFSILAPQATNHSWYPFSFLYPREQNEPWLSSALLLLDELVIEIKSKGIPQENIFFLGFSQGACLALEYTARHAALYGGIVAFSGGLIGETLNAETYGNGFLNTPVFMGSSDPDPHIPVERVRESAKIFEKSGADVTLKIYPYMGHTVSRKEIDLVNQLIFKAA